MIKKATAKSAEANAAVRRRAAGLDQRLRMSASVAGLPSIYIATACLSFFVAPSARARSTCTQTALLRITPVLKALPGDLSWKIYAVRVFCSSQSLAWAAYTELKRYAQKSQLAACNTLAKLQHELLQPRSVAFTARHLPFAPITPSATRADGAARPWHPWLQPCWQC